MSSRLRIRKKSTRIETPDTSTAPAQGMFQSRPFVVQTHSAEKSQQPDLKTALMRAQRYGHHLHRIQPAGLEVPTAVQRQRAEQDNPEQPIYTRVLKSTPDASRVVQCKFPGTKEEWNSQLATMPGATGADWVNLLTSLDEDGNSFKVESGKVIINDVTKLDPATLKGMILAQPNRLKEICDKSRSASGTLKPPSDYVNELVAEFHSLQSGGATTQDVTGAAQGYHNETYASSRVKPEDVVAQWKAFLGSEPYGNIHPRTGSADPERLVSNDGKRTIRYGSHERTSKPNKHHYHEETWTYDAVNNKLNVDNLVRRVPLKEK